MFFLVIQGRADVDDGKTSQTDVSKAVDFTYNAIQDNKPEKQDAVNGINGEKSGAEAQKWQDVTKDVFTTDEAKVLKMVKNVFADYFAVDTFDGRVARMERGNLGLVKVGAETAPAHQADGQQQQPPVMPQAAMSVPVAAGS